MLQAKSAQKRQTAIPLKRRNPVDGTLVIILIMLLLAGLLVLFSATFYTGTSTRSPYSEVLKQLLGIGLGTAACIVTSRIPYRCWQHPYVVVALACTSTVRGGGCRWVDCPSSRQKSRNSPWCCIWRRR